MRAPYLYSGLEAESYDSVDELSDFEDYPFYRSLVEANPGRVLDLGCGTGRILARLMEDGIEVVGLDSSRDMLEICREKLAGMQSPPRLELGDIRRFDLKETFQSILIPGFTIQLLMEPDEIDSCLLSCWRHLEIGGQLVVSTYMPWEMLESGVDESPIEKRRDAAFGETGERFVAWQGWSIDRREQSLELLNRFQRVDSENQVVEEENRNMSIRWHLPYDMVARIRSLGFTEISVYGDYQFIPPASDSESVIYVVSKG